MNLRQSNDCRGTAVATATWPDVEAALRSGAAAVLPVGAACKQHGRHLSMNTDYLQAEWLAARLAERARVAVWPVLSYGYYPAFADYPGSCSLSRGTFEDAVAEILDDILRAGARTVLVLNTGLSTIAPLEAAIARLNTQAVRLANVYRGPCYRQAAASVETQARGSHADEIETSIMLAIAPESVNMTRAESCTAPMQKGAFNRTRPGQPNYSPGGGYGDPRLATKEKGQLIVQAMLDDLLALLASPATPEAAI